MHANKAKIAAYNFSGLFAMTFSLLFAMAEKNISKFQYMLNHRESFVQSGYQCLNPLYELKDMILVITECKKKGKLKPV